MLRLLRHSSPGTARSCRRPTSPRHCRPASSASRRHPCQATARQPLGRKKKGRKKSKKRERKRESKKSVAPPQPTMKLSTFATAAAAAADRSRGGGGKHGVRAASCVGATGGVIAGDMAEDGACGLYPSVATATTSTAGGGRRRDGVPGVPQEPRSEPGRTRRWTAARSSCRRRR